MYPKCVGASIDDLAKLGTTDIPPDNALDTATQRALIRRPKIHFPSNTNGWGRCMRLSLMSRTKRRFQRRNVSSRLDSAVVITLLIDAESTLCESSRMPSADGVVRTTNRQKIYGNDVRRSCWNYAIVTLVIRLTKSSAFHDCFCELSSGVLGSNSSNILILSTTMPLYSAHQHWRRQLEIYSINKYLSKSQRSS